MLSEMMIYSGKHVQKQIRMSLMKIQRNLSTGNKIHAMKIFEQ